MKIGNLVARNYNYSLKLIIFIKSFNDLAYIGDKSIEF
ncbi:hypothetical protein Vi05172_g3681 [Venturia inaequalis]|nr:hypothetical protein Vi05172_g3681 [Venturia inaequalis]